MSTDTFEDELRSLLHDTADAEGPAYVDVDPGVVVTQGRRVVRRRRIATGAATAAAVLAVGITGAVVGGVGREHADTTVPAGPTTGLGSGSVSVGLVVDTAFGGAERTDPADPVSVRVEVNERTGKWRVSVVDREGHTTVRPPATLPANPRFSTYVQVGSGSGLIVGVMPAAAKHIAPVWLTDSVGSSFSSAPLPGTDRQAFAVPYSGAPDPYLPGELMFAGFDWTDGAQVFTSAGGSVPSARFGDTVTFVDANNNLFGMFGPDTTVTARMSDASPDGPPLISAAEQPLDSGMSARTILFVLPAGATDVEVVPDAGGSVDSVETSSGGAIGDTLVLARLTLPWKSPGTGAQRVRWTSTTGQKMSRPAGG